MCDRQDTVQHFKKKIQGSDDTNDRNARGEKVPKLVSRAGVSSIKIQHYKTIQKLYIGTKVINPDLPAVSFQ